LRLRTGPKLRGVLLARLLRGLCRCGRLRRSLEARPLLRWLLRGRLLLGRARACCGWLRRLRPLRRRLGLLLRTLLLLRRLCLRTLLLLRLALRALLRWLTLGALLGRRLGPLGRRSGGLCGSLRTRLGFVLVGIRGRALLRQNDAFSVQGFVLRVSRQRGKHRNSHTCKQQVPCLGHSMVSPMVSLMRAIKSKIKILCDIATCARQAHVEVMANLGRYIRPGGLFGVGGM
jgi:hypothetical protein